MTVIKIQLSQAALKALKRPVVGQGGFQSLLRKIQQELGTGSDLLLTIPTAQKIARYVEKYGQGGFQGRLAFILDELRGLAKALGSLAE